jgi:hypothetical protein
VRVLESRAAFDHPCAGIFRIEAQARVNLADPTAGENRDAILFHLGGRMAADLLIEAAQPPR